MTTRSCDQREDGGEGHLPGAEVQRHGHGREEQEGDQALDRLTADIGSPGRADEGRRHLCLRHVVRMGESSGDFLRLRCRQLVSLDPHAAVADDRHPGNGLRDDFSDSIDGGLLLRALDARDLELRSTAELDPEVEPALEDRDQDGDDHGDDGDREPDLAVRDEVEGTLSGVEFVAELSERRRHFALPLPRPVSAGAPEAASSAAFLSAMVCRLTASLELDAALRAGMATALRNCPLPR